MIKNLLITRNKMQLYNIYKLYITGFLILKPILYEFKLIGVANFLASKAICLIQNSSFWCKIYYI